MRERWPKERRSSGPIQRWLRSCSGVFRGTGTIVPIRGRLAWPRACATQRFELLPRAGFERRGPLLARDGYRQLCCGAGFAGAVAGEFRDAGAFESVQLSFIQPLECGGRFNGVAHDGQRFLDVASGQQRVGEEAEVVGVIRAPARGEPVGEAAADFVEPLVATVVECDARP